MSEVTGSIVLYNNEKAVLEKAIGSFLNTTLPVALYLVDNSPTDILKDISSDPRVIYIHNPSNPGFGAAHNIAINKAIKSGSKYHFIINPDIYFQGDVLTPMVNYMDAHNDVGMMMPRILYPDGTLQYLPKLLPNPLWIFRRKVKIPKASYNRFIEKYELRNIPEEKIYNAPILSGCFSLLSLKAVAEIGGYDDHYFMYFEDFDLSRRIHEHYKTLYYPKVSVYHAYERGANKSFKLLKAFISSAFRYFNKWGWVNDKKRNLFNKAALEQQ